MWRFKNILLGLNHEGFSAAVLTKVTWLVHAMVLGLCWAKRSTRRVIDRS